MSTCSSERISTPGSQLRVRLRALQTQCPHPLQPGPALQQVRLPALQPAQEAAQALVERLQERPREEELREEPRAVAGRHR